MDKNRIRFWQADGSPAGTLEPHPTCDPTTPKRPARTFVYRPPSTATTMEMSAVGHPLRRKSDRALGLADKHAPGPASAETTTPILPSRGAPLLLAEPPETARISRLKPPSSNE